MPQPRPAEDRPPTQSQLPRWSLVLRALRESSGVTQDGWATHLGYSRATVQRWERGQSIPDAAAEQALIALCDQRGLMRTFDQGPLGGLTLTADFLRDLFAEARAAATGAATPELPPNLTRLFGRLRERYARTDDAPVEPEQPPAPPTNLPAQGTAFVGREQERQDVARLLQSTRLLTLLGPGGIGKTRLAVEVGREFANSYPDGVWLVDLSAVVDPALVPAAAAAAVGVREESGRSLTESLIAALTGRTTLLVLDNCEHLLDAGARLAGALLRGCPGVCLIATSRTPLGLPAETVLRVPPLSVDSLVDGGTSTNDSGDASAPPRTERRIGDAVRLFVERAVAALPTFQLTETNAGVVAHICRSLDGLPLAIELAAARVRILTPEQIAARLDARVPLLVGPADAGDRHRTLQAAIAWSYDLLSAPEQRLLTRLSVFTGGCEIDAIESVCTGDGVDGAALFDLVTYLVDKSLLVVEHRGTAARYRMLEMVRAFAAERLEADGGTRATRDRHIAYVLTVVEGQESRLVGPEQPAAVERISRDIDNIRAALDHAISSASADTAATLAARLWRFWLLSGRVSEGRDWIARVLAVGDALPPAQRARLLDAAGTLAHVQGAYAESQRAHEESLSIWRSLDEPMGIAGALGSLGLALKSRGDLDGATQHLEAALALWRSAGQDARSAMLLNNLAAVAMDQGDFDRADRYQEESLALKRRTGDQAGIAISLHNLSETARYRGNYERALILGEESITIFRSLGLKPNLAQTLQAVGVVAARLGDRRRAVALLREGLELFRDLGIRSGVPLCLESLAEVAIFDRDPQTAARLLGAAESIREEIDAPMPPSARPAYDAAVAALHASLPKESLSALWAAGRALTTAQAIEAGLAAAT